MARHIDISMDQKAAVRIWSEGVRMEAERRSPLKIGSRWRAAADGDSWVSGGGGRLVSGDIGPTIEMMASGGRDSIGGGGWPAVVELWWVAVSSGESVRDDLSFRLSRSVFLIHVFCLS